MYPFALKHHMYSTHIQGINKFSIPNVTLLCPSILHNNENLYMKYSYSIKDSSGNKNHSLK